MADTDDNDSGGGSVDSGIEIGHALVFGGSGSGKSDFAYLLIREQLRRRASLLAIDPNPETVRRLRGAFEEAGLPAERAVVIESRDAAYAPPKNPFHWETYPAGAGRLRPQAEARIGQPRTASTR